MQGPQSLNRDHRKKELLRITRENQMLLKRIQQAQPNYNHIQWENEHRQQQSYAAVCSEYPRLRLSARGPSRPTSELLPLQGEAHQPPTGSFTARVRELPAIEGPGDESVKHVLRDFGLVINGTYYLVDMA